MPIKSHYATARQQLFRRGLFGRIGHFWGQLSFSFNQAPEKPIWLPCLHGGPAVLGSFHDLVIAPAVDIGMLSLFLCMGGLEIFNCRFVFQAHRFELSRDLTGCWPYGLRIFRHVSDQLLDQTGVELRAYRRHSPYRQGRIGASYRGAGCHLHRRDQRRKPTNQGLQFLG